MMRNVIIEEKKKSALGFQLMHCREEIHPENIVLCAAFTGHSVPAFSCEDVTETCVCDEGLVHATNLSLHAACQHSDHVSTYFRLF